MSDISSTHPILDISATPAPSSMVATWLPYLLLIIAVLLTYCNVYDNTLLFDDTIIISSNDFLKSWGTFGQLLLSSTTAGSHATGGFYRPVQMALYFFIYQISGLDPLLYHLLNVVLHAANACLVFTLGRRLNFNSWGAFFAALLWAVHPLHTEVITYASGTAEPLFAFFCLLGVVILTPGFTPRRFLIALPIFILGLLSKELAVVFPALVISCIFLLDKNRLHPKTYLRTWPLWLMTISYAYWRATMPGLDGPQTYDAFYAAHGYDTLQLYAGHFWYRFYTFLATLPYYLKLLVWPTGLHMERSFMVYDDPFVLEVSLGLLMVLGATAQIIWTQTRPEPKRGLPLSWGFLWFAAAHFPNTGLIVPMNSQFLEHWMYLPSIGLFLGLGEMLSLSLTRPRCEKAKPVLASAASIIAALLAVKTFEQNVVWSNPFTFYGNIFEYGEVSPRAHNNLALAYMDEGDYPGAVAEFGKAIAESDTYAETRYNLALALLHLPNSQIEIPEIIENFKRSTELDPHFYRAWEKLAAIYDYRGDADEAAACRAKAEEAYKSITKN